MLGLCWSWSLGFGERWEEGWMTGFNNRWDHEGEMADENRQKKGEEDPWLPTYRELGEDAQ